MRESKLTILIIDFENRVSKYADYTYSGLYTTSIDEGRTVTRLVNVKPTATAISTISVATATDEYYSDVTVVNVLLPTGAGQAVTVRPPPPIPLLIFNLL